MNAPLEMSMTVPLAIIDTLNGVLEGEQNSVFRSLSANAPYLTRAAMELRRALDQMVQTSRAQAAQLARLIEELGGEPAPPGIVTEEQYLAYLSLKFLVPKLIDAKRGMIRRYENALKALGQAPPRVRELLEHHLAQHRQQLELLENTRVA